jgi:hypothetical protein
MTPPPTDNQNPNNLVRDQAWLEHQLQAIWHNHFYDVARLNTVTIKWGKNSRTRLGTISIKAKHPITGLPAVSEIRINPLLQDPNVPPTVVWQTIAHELAHYTHGYCSPHPKKYAHPHRGNVIEKELRGRNLSTTHDHAESWLKEHWHAYVAASVGPKRQRARTRRSYYVHTQPVSILSHLRKIASRRRRLGR